MSRPSRDLTLPTTAARLVYPIGIRTGPSTAGWSIVRLRGPVSCEIRPATSALSRLALEGTTCNRDAIGARITITTDGDVPTQIETLRAGEGYLSQSSKWIHFGLGTARQIEQVTVHWPGGETEEFQGLHPGQRYVLRQGSGHAEPWLRESTATALVAQPVKVDLVSEQARIVLAGRVPMPALPYETPNGGRQQLAPRGYRSW